MNKFTGLALSAAIVIASFPLSAGNISLLAEEQPEPVARYTFEDALSPGKDSTGIHSLSPKGAGIITQVETETGHAALFDGQSWLESSSTDDFTDSFTDYTVTFRAKRDASAQGEMIVAGSGWRYTTNGMHINLNDGYFCAGLHSDAGGESWLWYQSDVCSSMHHYAVVVSGGGKKASLYLDGALVKECAPESGSFSMSNDGNPFSVGALANGSGWGGYMFKGVLDDLLVYDTALSPSELSDSMNTDWSSVPDNSFGLKNPDGSLIYGINYTPAYIYGWFPSAMSEEYYRPEKMRAELEDIKSMGFNSVRILSPIHSGIFAMADDAFNTALEGYRERYSELFTICRELSVTADVIMPCSVSLDSGYSVPGSKTERVIDMYINNLGSEFRDVIVLWEIANEPDVNTWGLSYEDEIKAFRNDAVWNGTTKPFLEWAAKKIDGMYSADPSLKVIPKSIGCMNSARCDSWDAANMDVLNIHVYKRTNAESELFVNQAYDMDIATLGYRRPVVLSEVMMAGMTQPADDIIDFCQRTGAAFYLWAYAAVSYEQETQGLADMTGRTRIATLPLEMIKGVQKYAPLSVSSYDLTFGGTNQFNTPYYYVNRALASGSQSDLSIAAEHLYNWARYTVPYYTEGYETVINSSVTEGMSAMEKYRYMIALAGRMALPYIRTSGSCTNDNRLGGTGAADYYESVTGYNTISTTNTYRARYAFGEGKSATKGLLIQDTDTLFMRSGTTDGSYSFEAQVRPLTDSTAKIGVMCGEGETVTSNPGLYVRIARDLSDDIRASETLSNKYQKAYTVQVYIHSRTGAVSHLAAAQLYEDEFDSDGYAALRVDYTGSGSPSDPLRASVYVGGVLKATVSTGNINTDGHTVNCYPSLGCDNGSAAYFDNVRLSGEDGVVFSDSFETGKYDYQYLTYTPDRSQNTAFGGTRDNLWLKSVLGDFIAEAGGSAAQSYTAVRNLSSSYSNGYLSLSWDSDATDGYGFEIQKSTDGGLTYSQLWRVAPDSVSTVIPCDTADGSLYRVGLISAENEVTALSSSVSIGAEDGLPQLLARYSFEDKNNIGKDSAGNNDLTIRGSGTVVQVNGRQGSAAKFDGDVCLAADNAFTQLTDYTITAFVSTGQSTADPWRTVIQNGSALRAFLRADGWCILQNESGEWLNSSSGISAGTMHHYAFAISKSTGKISVYVDGVLKSESLNASALSEDNGWHVFSLAGVSDIAGYSGECCACTLDEVNVYRGVPDASAIEALYGSYTDSSAQSSLVAHYSFDNPESLGTDSVGGNTLTNRGGVTGSDGGVRGGAAYFAGTGYTDSLYLNGADFTDRLTDFTVTCFTKADGQPSGNGCILSTGWDPSGGLSFGLSGANHIFADATSNGTAVWEAALTGLNPAGGYHFYALSVSDGGRVISLYIDGIRKSARTLAVPLTMANGNMSLVLGQCAWYGGYYFKGFLDELTVYSRGLSDTEITRAYKTALTTVRGDINGDGRADIKDFVAMKKCAAGTDGIYCTENSDFNGSGGIDTYDIIVFRKILLGIVSV